MKKGKDFLKAFDYIDDEYLDLVEEMKVKNNNKGFWRSKMAAAVCLGVVASASAVAYASNMFGVKDLIFSHEKNTTEIQEVVDADGHLAEEGVELEYITEASSTEAPVVDDETIDLISMSGFNNSPEAMALKEWYDFCENYDTDGKIMDAHNYDEPDTWGKDVMYYRVYSDEMANKLREIAGKYNLELHTGLNTMPFADFEAYFGGKVIPDDSECYGAYYYEDGTIAFDSGCIDEDGYAIDYQVSRCMKGVLDETYLNIGNAGDYKQEAYTTADGTDVILALSDSKALIVVDSDNSFTVVNVLLDWYGKYVGGDFVKGEFTMDKLEAFADTINLKLLCK